MAMQALTVRGIEALKPQAKRYEVFDALTPGLAIRVTPHGHKSWVLFYRHHGRLRRLTLGRYPDRPLAGARSEAVHERGRILDGADPATEKHDERATYGDTVGALYDLYQIVMLLTAQRRGEICTMRWQDVDLTTAWWTIPAESSKNADPHRVPLTPMAVEILKRRSQAENRDSRYVFSNHRTTCVVDRAKKAAAFLCKGWVSFHFRAHDLRRTAASYMGEAGVDRFHIAHVLNHRSVTHKTVTAIYDRYRYDKEKRAALEKWADVLFGIVDVKPAPTKAPARRARRQNVYEFSPQSRRRAGASVH